MAWDKTKPTSATYIMDIPSVFQANYNAIENIMGVDHYTYSSALSGRHKPGIVPVLVADVASSLATTGITSGAMGFATEVGALLRFDGAASAWNQVNLDPYPIVDVYRTGDQSIPSAAEGTYTGIVFNTEITDTMSAFNSSTGVFVAPTTGYYLVKAQVEFTGIEGGIDTRLAVSVLSSASAVQYSLVNYASTLDTSAYTLTSIMLLYIEAAEQIALSIWHDNSASQTVDGGQDVTWLKIYKLS